MLAQNTSKFPPVVPIKSQTLANSEIFVSLTELADFPTSKDFVFGGLEIRFND